MQMVSVMEVPQSLDEVWSMVGDPASSPEWDKSVARVDAVNDVPLGVGWEGQTTAPSGMQQRFRITSWEPQRFLAFDLLESGYFRSARLAFELAELHPGVRITHRITVEPRNLLFALVLRLTARKALGADMDALRDALAARHPKP